MLPAYAESVLRQDVTDLFNRAHANKSYATPTTTLMLAESLRTFESRWGAWMDRDEACSCCAGTGYYTAPVVLDDPESGAWYTDRFECPCPVGQAIKQAREAENRAKREALQSDPEALPF